MLLILNLQNYILFFVEKLCEKMLPSELLFAEFKSPRALYFFGRTSEEEKKPQKIRTSAKMWVALGQNGLPILTRRPTLPLPFVVIKMRADGKRTTRSYRYA